MNSYKLIIKEKTQPLKRNIDEEHKLMINWKVNVGVPVVQKKKKRKANMIAKEYMKDTWFTHERC